METKELIKIMGTVSYSIMLAEYAGLELNHRYSHTEVLAQGKVIYTGDNSIEFLNQYIADHLLEIRTPMNQ